MSVNEEGRSDETGDDLARGAGEDAPWRCLYCDDELAEGEDCPKSDCTMYRIAAERRMKE